MNSPVLKYPGAKWRIARWIADRLPPHDIYLEPYFGSGAVFFNKGPSKLEIVNDLDHNVVNLFSVIRLDSEKLAALIDMTPWARAEYDMACTALDALESFVPLTRDVIAARLYLVRCWQAFGTMTGQKTGWRHNGAVRKGSCARQWANLPDRIMEVAVRLKDAEIECTDALGLIGKYNVPNCLVYADPPYMPGTRRGRIYAKEMSGADHGVLLDALAAHRGPVAVSGYDSDLYNDRLRDWQRHERPAVAERGRKRTEVLWIKEGSSE
jgi:DNA adenine methylase